MKRNPSPAPTEDPYCDVVIAFDRRRWRVRLAEIGAANLREFAESAGLSVATLRLVSNGLVPSPEYRQTLAAALGLEVDELWKEIPEHIVSAL